MGKKIKSTNIISDDVEQELFIEEDYLNEEIMDQPLKFRKWARLEVEADRRVKSIRLKLEQTKAMAYLEAKRELNKPTVRELESYVSIDPDVVKIEDELIVAEAELSDAKMIVKAFYQRHESLKDLAANLRKELID